MPVSNIIMAVLFSAVFLVFFLPAFLKISRSFLALLLVVTALAVMIYQEGVVGIVYVSISTFFLWALTFSFLVNRKYPYILAMLFLALCPVLLILNMDSLASVFVVLTYICLLLGILKDIFYNKIVEGKKQ